MKALLVVYRGPQAVPIMREPDACWDWLDIAWDPGASFSRGSDWVVPGWGREGRKFRAAYRTAPVLGYDAVCLADDDVEPVGCTWTDIFRLFTETGARIAQPALTRDSHHSHAITLQEDGVRWRETTFVECMCPILSAAAVLNYWKELDQAGLGWGLETLWEQREREAGRSLAILDATPVRHARPVGGGHRGLDADPTREADEYSAARGLVRAPAETLMRHR